jgi:hypothetical protein
VTTASAEITIYGYIEVDESDNFHQEFFTTKRLEDYFSYVENVPTLTPSSILTFRSQDDLDMECLLVLDWDYYFNPESNHDDYWGELVLK